MPTSAQSAVSASARLSVDGSEGDREPARDNVIPFNVDYHRGASARANSLNRNARSVDRHQLALDDRLRLASAIAHVDPLAVEPLVVSVTPQGPLGSRRRDLEVIRTVDVVGVIDKRACDAAHALAILDRDRLDAVDRDAECSSRVAGLVERVELVTHVLDGGLEQLSDGRYGPGRHVAVSENNLHAYRSGWTRLHTTSRGAALKIEL